jgi:hypothetical protein|tara:strand:- start:271 stop:873 length:603 start_codon:yes stop_codon:yes gene_type:complete
MSKIKVNSLEGVGASASAITIHNSDGTCTLASGSKLNNCTTDGTTNFTIADGNLVVGTSGHGIDFSATSGTGTSEILSDFEEGTWTASTVTGTATFTGTIYTRIGRLVYIQGKIGDFSDRSSSNSVGVSGLPFAPSVGVDQVIGSVMYRYVSSQVYHSTYLTSSGTLQFYGGHSADFVVMGHNMLSASSTFIYFNGVYQI